MVAEPPFVEINDRTYHIKTNVSCQAVRLPHVKLPIDVSARDVQYSAYIVFYDNFVEKFQAVVGVVFVRARTR